MWVGERKFMKIYYIEDNPFHQERFKRTQQL